MFIWVYTTRERCNLHLTVIAFILIKCNCHPYYTHAHDLSTVE